MWTRWGWTSKSTLNSRNTEQRATGGKPAIKIAVRLIEENDKLYNSATLTKESQKGLDQCWISSYRETLSSTDVPQSASPGLLDSYMTENILAEL